MLTDDWVYCVQEEERWEAELQTEELRQEEERLKVKEILFWTLIKSESSQEQ